MSTRCTGENRPFSSSAAFKMFFLLSLALVVCSLSQALPASLAHEFLNSYGRWLFLCQVKHSCSGSHQTAESSWFFFFPLWRQEQTGCQSDLRLQSERSPARRTFLGAFDISAVTALLKNLGGGVEAVPRLTWLVQFITPWCLYNRL